MPTFVRLLLPLIFLLVASGAAVAGEPTVLSGLPYKTGDLTPLERERCVLDLYLPEGKGFPTLVWFHGGGLTEGKWNDAFTSNIAKAYARAGIAVAAVGYRLSPTVKFPGYVEDGAAAFAWVHRHIGEHGGDQRAVFLGGHSAGAYLALMIGLDLTYLGKQQLGQDAIAGLVPVAGQTLTHYTVRIERGLPKETIIADEAAPLHFVRKDTPPMLLMAAERDMAMRVEENQLLLAAFKAAGNTTVGYYFAAGRTHGTIAEWMARPDDPVAGEVIAFITRVVAQRTAAKP